MNRKIVAAVLALASPCAAWSQLREKGGAGSPVRPVAIGIPRR